MSASQQIKALVRSYAEGDGEHFLSVALQIAATAARSGDGKLAQELRDLVDEIKTKQSSGQLGRAVPIARPRGELAGLLAVTYPKTRFNEMVLNASAKSQLERVIREFRNLAKLREHALTARRKLLLIGPPGCGKTMTASAMAGELKLPLFSVQLHGLITKFMGETAAKLAFIFDAMAETRGVYLFDEFDAIGADRGASNDVGEIRRVLNSFLQFLEQNESDSLIIAATNYVEMLDEALFRRFDDVIEYVRPADAQIDELVRNRLQAFLGKRISWKSVREEATGLSHAEISRACDDAAKDCILGGTTRVTTAALVSSLKERRRSDPKETLRRRSDK
jgi:SpoVK/Ycf46/Vps4 family AAA+-type ATPase